MKILAIETSCDETACAILEASGGFEGPHFQVLGTTLLSQALKHREFGGVYPNLAKREHAKNLVPVLRETLKKAESLEFKNTPLSSTQEKEMSVLLKREPELCAQLLDFIPHVARPDIDAIVVTQGPGLEPALWVGINFAKALSVLWNIPLIPVNHMEGHIVSVLWEENRKSNLAFPALALLISGGHTELILVNGWLNYRTLGETRDDAVGEAFDKTARLLGLPYPGGPEIGRLAQKAREHDVHRDDIVLPRPMINSDGYDFSFSGLKTAVRYLVQNLGKLDEITKQVIAREFENAVGDVLVAKTDKAIEAHNPKTLIIGGGVIASTYLRARFQEYIKNHPAITLRIPALELATDNAVMIGIAGYFRTFSSQHSPDIRAEGNLRLS